MRIEDNENFDRCGMLKLKRGIIYILYLLGGNCVNVW